MNSRYHLNWIYWRHLSCLGQMISLEDRVYLYVLTVHYDSPDTASPDVLTDPNMDQDNTTTCTETETQHSMDITTTDMDSGEETGREDMSPQVGRCGCARCDYGGLQYQRWIRVVEVTIGVTSVL